MTGPGLVAESLACIARAAVGEGAATPERNPEWYAEDDWTVMVASYDRDFSRLWGLSDGTGGLAAVAAGLRSRPTTPRTVLVVWDRIPHLAVERVSLSRYLTPIDWAVGLSLAMTPDAATAEPLPGLRFLILDLGSEWNQESESVRLFRGVPGRQVPWLPWIRMVPPFDTNGKWDGASLVEDLCTGGESAFQGIPTLEQIREAESLADGLALTRMVWKGFFNASQEDASHHDISNVLGPLLLVGKAGDPATRALDSLLRAAGLFASGQESGMDAADDPEPAWIDWETEMRPGLTWSEARRRLTANGKALDLVLVDDLWKTGWGEVVCQAVGAPYVPGEPRGPAVHLGSAAGISVWGISDAPSFWEARSEDPAGSGLGILPAAEDEQPRKASEILLLDLRLFSGRSLHEEAEFFTKLCGAAKNLEEREHLPWQGFTEAELHRIDRWVEAVRSGGAASREDPGYLEALTLLPRVLALTNSTLPIILFSSTGRRSITEKLKPYGNIVTLFDKPRVWERMAADHVLLARGRLVDALGRGLELALARSALDTLRSLPVPRATGAAAGELSANSHIEVYIDEAGTIGDPTKFRVAGIALLADEAHAIDSFNDQLLTTGLCWGPTERQPDGYRGQLPKDLRWRDWEQRVFGPLKEVLDTTRVVPVAFCLRRAASIPHDEVTDLASPRSLDNIYRALVGDALEILIHECGPSMIGAQRERFTCKIYVATRVRVRGAGDTNEIWNHYRNAFGVQTKRNTGGASYDYFLSISSDSVYPLVAEVLSRGPNTPVRVNAAKGARLYYGPPPPIAIKNIPLPRPAHFLAHVVASFLSGEGNPTDHRKWVGPWLSNGFNTTVTHSFVKTLEACRHSRTSRHVDALVAAASTAVPPPPWAAPAIRRSVSSLTGDQFVEFADRLTRVSART
jgi:hypothetical protein